MRKNNIIKSVSFNETNPDDKKMLKDIKRRRNFSGYMKKLLMADIEAREQKTTQNKSETTQSEAISKTKEQYEPETKPTATPQEISLSSAEKLEQMRRQSKKTGGNSQPKSFINHQ